MPLNIRDPRATELARELAEQQGTTMTAVVIDLLEKEVQRRSKELSLSEKIDAIILKAKALSKTGGHKMSRDEIDDMWGQ